MSMTWLLSEYIGFAFETIANFISQEADVIINVLMNAF